MILLTHLIIFKEHPRDISFDPDLAFLQFEAAGKLFGLIMNSLTRSFKVILCSVWGDSDYF
jgi:hypothetical protein